MNQNLPTIQDQLPSTKKPGKVQAIAIMMLVSGVLNIFYGLILTVSVAIIAVGVGLLCLPLTISPTVLGIIEVIAASKLLNSEPRKIKVQTIAILEIVSIITLDVLSAGVGILNLVFYNDPEVKRYLDSLPD